MDAGTLDVLHHSGYQRLAAVADRVDFGLYALKVLVDEDWPAFGNGLSFADVPHEVARVLDYLHGAAAQHVAGTHEHRVADELRRLQRLVDGCDSGARWLGDAERL